MKKIFFKIVLDCIILAFLYVQSSFSQVNQEWVARYNGPGDSSDTAYPIAVDDLGNVYVTGESYMSGTGEDYATIKYNSSGLSQWVQRYNGPGNSDDLATSIVLDDSGNVYVTGYSVGSGTREDYATIKYNSAGVQQWIARYNGPGNDFDVASSIAVDGLGNVYVAGQSYGSGTHYDFATVKYNSSGVQQWAARYNGPGNLWEGGAFIAIDSSDNVYVTGSSDGSGTDEDYATIKYNSSGVQQWVRRYNGPGNLIDYANSIAIDESGNAYITGSSYDNASGFDYATIKYNSSGDSVWVKRFNGPGNSSDAAYSIAVDGSGNVFVIGQSIGNGTSFDYAIIKYNSSGDQQWVQRYNGPEYFTAHAGLIAVDDSGNVYVTGISPNSGTAEDYATIKFNASGDSVWVKKYNGPGNSYDIATSIAVDGLGNVYVTGRSTGIGTYYDYATIKYSQSTGITQISSEIPEQFSLSKLSESIQSEDNNKLRIKNYELCEDDCL